MFWGNHSSLKHTQYHIVYMCTDLETLNEKREDIQDTEADFSGHAALQQSLMVDFCFWRPHAFNMYTPHILKLCKCFVFTVSIKTNFKSDVWSNYSLFTGRYRTYVKPAIFQYNLRGNHYSNFKQRNLFKTDGIIISLLRTDNLWTNQTLLATT